MDEFLTGIDSMLHQHGEALAALGVVAFLLFMVAVMTAAGIANTRHQRHLAEMEATLKMEMLERGMSAQEIKSVLEARISQNTSWGNGAFKSCSAWKAPEIAKTPKA